MSFLRQATDRDIDVLFEHWQDPEANRMAAFTTADPSDRSAWDERWQRFREQEDITALVIETGGDVVGWIGSWDNDGQRELTYWLGRPYWGRGIATRAVAEFLTRYEPTRPIEGVTAADNLGSQRVLEKCGFRRVAGGRGYSNARGCDVDEVVFRLD